MELLRPWNIVFARALYQNFHDDSVIKLASVAINRGLTTADESSSVNALFRVDCSSIV